jgi:hypothetical protein
MKLVRIKITTNLYISLYLQKIWSLYCVASVANWRRFLEKKQLCNNICNCGAVINFIHSRTDTMFKRQFCRTRPDFWVLNSVIMAHKIKNGYNKEQHYSFANISSGSPITLELQLYVTLCLLSGASYVNCIWYAIDINSVHNLFWNTDCLIDTSIDNIKQPIDALGAQQLDHSWAHKRCKYSPPILVLCWFWLVLFWKE